MPSSAAGNKITDDGAQALAEMLRVNSSLQVLNLFGMQTPSRCPASGIVSLHHVSEPLVLALLPGP